MLTHLFSAVLTSVSLIFTPLHCYANETQLASGLDRYFTYLNDYPQAFGPLGHVEKGEIEIIQDKQKIAEIEKRTGRQVGVVAEDKYWIWINDAVQCPNKKPGVYGRLLWRSSLKGPTGIAVMMVLPNKKIVLNRNFRHATRSWEYELPRGVIDANETPQTAAAREVREETGMIIDDLHLLGSMLPDSGTVSSVVPIFVAEVIAKGKDNQQGSEAIASIDAFSINELKQGFVKGYLTAKVGDEILRVNLRDPFLSYALLIYENKAIPH